SRTRIEPFTNFVGELLVVGHGRRTVAPRPVPPFRFAARMPSWDPCLRVFLRLTQVDRADVARRRGPRPAAAARPRHDRPLLRDPFGNPLRFTERPRST